MTLYFVTGNEKKFAEARVFFPHVEQLDIDLPEIQSLDSQEIISRKLQAASRKFAGKKIIVEDTSLVFHAWNGLPGPLVKWYLQTVGDKGIWHMINSFADKSASAICTIGYSDGEKTEFFEGIVTGTIVEPTVDSHFGRDALFQPDGFDKTFAHMTKEEKNAVSHRGKALHLLEKYLLSS
jgi:inosine triphosphate pyrophosphatase